MIKPCKCRECGKKYDEYKGTADFKGYCSQKCFHERAKKFGYRVQDPTRRSEYSRLHAAGEVGSVEWVA